VTFQIVMSTSWNLDIKYPSPFNELLGALSVLSLDFLALECFQGNVANRYFTTVYLWSSIPLVCSGLILLVMFIRLGELKYRVRELLLRNSSEAAYILNQHMWIFLLLTYLVLPPVAMKQLQSLDCIPFSHDHSSYLRADTGIDCQSNSYEHFKSVMIFFIILYQSIPILWMILLYRKRAALDPLTSNHDEKLALYIRDHNPNLTSLNFLFKDYKCNKWWFEVAEMYRRIVFVGILPLVSPITATRASMGVVLAIMSVAYYREEKPYRVGFTNFIAYMAQFTILITFYGALSIDTGVMMDFGLKDLGMGIFLLSTNILIFGLCMWLGYVRYHRDRKKFILRRGKADQIEQAGLFTQEKFKTTFEFITRASVPISHVLAFHYTTLKLAKFARHSGIPALKKYDGVAFTLRQPHATTHNDSLVFRTNSHHNETDESIDEGSDVVLDSGFPNDAVLVMALPKHVLDKLPGFEDDTCLLRVSTDILKFMKPSSFTAVIDARPWLYGIVLMSPASIIRCYSLTCEESNGLISDERGVSGGLTITQRLTSSASSIGKPHTKSITAVVKSEGTNNSDNKHGEGSMIEREFQDSLYGSSNWVREEALYSKLNFNSYESPNIIKISTMLDYIQGMRKARLKASKMNMIPLYHFTQSNVVNLILRNGLRMSTQGQGDGGVYFSTQGPASFKYGTPEYEMNIIRTCFGVHRLKEYVGLGKLDAVVVYACSPNALHQVKCVYMYLCVCVYARVRE
jgi:hypothetical protein